MLKLGTRPRPRELGFAAPVGRPRLRPTSVETPTLPPASAAPAPTNRPQNRRRPRKNATQTPLATVAEAPSRPGVASKPALKPGVDRSAKSPEPPLFAFLTRRRRPSRLPSRNDPKRALEGQRRPPKAVLSELPLELGFRLPLVGDIYAQRRRVQAGRADADASASEPPQNPRRDARLFAFVRFCSVLLVLLVVCSFC